MNKKNTKATEKSQNEKEGKRKEKNVCTRDTTNIISSAVTKRTGAANIFLHDRVCVRACVYLCECYIRVNYDAKVKNKIGK